VALEFYDVLDELMPQMRRVGAYLLDKVVRLLPPYIITEKEADRALKVLGKMFKNGRPAQ
jgi:4-aminobutyrate aminotransferase-like enzyme